jgi:hypothetical protein
VYFVFEITSPRSSVKYGRSSRRNLHLRTRFSRVWYAESSPPSSSDSRVIRRQERLKVDYTNYVSFGISAFGTGDEQLTLKANFSSASEYPGNTWYRVPALATTVRVVVGPGRSRLANFTPAALPVSYWKLPEAAAARPRRGTEIALTCRRKVCVALRPSRAGVTIVAAASCKFV